jgi:ATPase subunit of ABC transporter with duplicated ATPase domains
MRALEVIHINALRSFLGCPLFAGHDSSLLRSVTQRHNRVHATKQQQRKRQRDVQHQPTMQPVMQKRLTP